MIFRKDNANYWESITDMMTGLMLIFLFISLAFMFQVQEIAKEYQSTKYQIYQDLKDEFSEEELASWGAVIDKKTMAVSFIEPEVFFNINEATITPRFQEILNSFFPRYIAILQKDEYQDKISEVRIEGHASKEVYEDDSDYVYFYNMQLSQARARNVLAYTFSIWQMQDKKQWLMQYVTANGLSYSKATDNSNTSRKVEFRVLTNAEQELSKIYGEEE